MDIDNIELTPGLIADLYSSVLVEANDNVLPVTELQASKTERSITFTGGNRKQIVIIVRYENTDTLPGEDQVFLSEMLSACKLSNDDVAIVNIHNHQQFTYKELNSKLNPRVVLLFDTEPTALGLPISFPFFQLQVFGNQTYLSSPSLQELKKDKILKSKIWVSLRRLFNV